MRIKNFDTKKKILIVGEIGNNHEGSLSNAKKLIDMAAKAGVNAVKFQTFKTENFISKEDIKNFKKFKKFELKFDDFKILSNYAKKKGLFFFSTPLDLESANYLDKICDAVKIASSDNNFNILIDKVLKRKKPVIISTGFLSSNDTAKLLKYLSAKKRKNIGLLHCVSSYPANEKEVNLLSIKNLENKFDIEIGYSDHTLGLEASLCAVSLGARIIEKHITLDKNFSNFRDHYISSDFSELSKLVKQIRKIELILGKPIKTIQKNEKKILNKVRRKAFAAKKIDKNEFFNENNLKFLRSSRKQNININKILQKKSKNIFVTNQIIED